MTQMSRYPLNGEMRTDKRTPVVTWNETIIRKKTYWALQTQTDQN